jgi:DNA-binding NtrC family response regulator
MRERRSKILVVDDDSAVVEFLVEALRDEYDVGGTTSPKDALERAVTTDLDLVIADLEMPEMRGLDLLQAILDRNPGQLVMLITAFGSVDLAVHAVRAGACDFVTKPFRTEVLLLAVERALRERSMRREIVRLRDHRGDPPSGLVARSLEMREVLEVARRAARSHATVLITGESGTGKGALARWIHDHSPRRDGPMLEVNCAAMPGGLVEAELFGVRRGAFTDARESRDGLFVEASKGTLFLDEIGEMPLEAQAKLLGVLESNKVRPVGDTNEVEVDVRVVAATNRAIEDDLRDGRFRTDLFYRLNVIRIAVPPLRERADDIPDLVRAFLARRSRVHGEALPLGISEDALRWLMRQPWPGNVRELANVIERAVALTEHDTIVLEDVVDVGTTRDAVPDLLAGAVKRRLSLDEVERQYLQQTLDECGGNVSRAARILGIDRRTLYRKLNRS